MLKELLQGYVADIELVVLLLASGVLVLLSTHSIFQLDPMPKARESFIPGREPELVPEFLYMSHFAEDARRRLLFVADFIRFVLIFLLLFVVVSFAIDALFSFLIFAGVATEEASWWQKGPYGKELAHNIFIFLTIGAAALLSYWSAEITFRIVKAHDWYRDKKTYTVPKLKS